MTTPTNALLTDPLLRDLPQLEGHRVLDGRYVIFDVLGRGGMGVVYRAHHLGLGIDVAIKCLDPALASSDPQFVARFAREARAAARVQDDHVVAVRDVSEASGLHYITMEFISGENARQRVLRKGPLPVSEAIAIALGAAQGLAAAHSASLVHRDIKPDNILVSTSGEVKVADLGLAKITSDTGMTLTGMGMGTPKYMPPEQFEDAKNVDTRTDVYALGATLYFLLVGVDGISGETPHEVMRRVCDREFPKASKSRPDVHRELAAFIDRCVDKNPAKRPSDGSALVAELLAMTGNAAATGPTDLAEDPSLPSLLAMSMVTPPPLNTLAAIQQSLTAAPPTADAPLAVAEWPEGDMARGDVQGDASETTTVVSKRAASPTPTSGRGLSRVLVALLPLIALGALGWWLRETNTTQTSPSNTQPMDLTPALSESTFSWTKGQPAPQVKGFTLVGDNAEGYPEYDKDLGGGVTMRFVVVPAGSFTMGSPASEEGHSAAEGQHPVILEAFLLAKTECTQRQWQAVMGNNPSDLSAAGLNAPVENVSWDDIQEFESKTILSLPSEAQWEYAARAGTQDARHGPLSTIAWSWENSDSSTHVVGQKQANSFGLHDMIGNVWEWCEDTWQKSYARAPSNGSAWVDARASYRVYRGGSWILTSWFCRSAYREWNEPGFRDDNLGFRPAKLLR